jgi:hypothetical protein
MNCHHEDAKVCAIGLLDGSTAPDMICPQLDIKLGSFFKNPSLTIPATSAVAGKPETLDPDGRERYKKDPFRPTELVLVFAGRLTW